MKRIAVSLALLSAAANASFTGSDFAAQCSGKSEEFCNGAMQAYLYMLEDRNICYRIPEGATTDDVRRATLSFVGTHPSASRISASILVTQAIMTHYPCHLN